MPGTPVARTQMRRWLSRVVAALVLLVGVATGIFLYVRETRAQACEKWHSALQEVTSVTARSVGSVEARLFRKEAILRGWVEIEGRRVVRPSGCIP
jgi:hypothetical protein